MRYNNLYSEPEVEDPREYATDFPEAGYYIVKISYITDSGKTGTKKYQVFGRDPEAARRSASNQFRKEYPLLRKE